MTRRGWILLAAWAVVLALGIIWVQANLEVSADLRLFMPAPRTEGQRLLIQNIGESPASRLLLLAIEGDQPAQLAQISKRFAAGIGTREEFAFVANGAQPAPGIPDQLLPYRYLITDSFDGAPLDEQRLVTELEDRAADMASPAAGFLEEWLPRDPTLEMLHLAQRWQPRAEPHQRDGVWFSSDGRRALLLVETRAAAFDPDGQGRALTTLQEQFARARGPSPASLTVSGTGYFSSVIRDRTQYEATWFGSFDTIGLIALLWLAYRRFVFTICGALPLLTAGLAGLGAVSLLFDGVHGITIAFGFTLIGVAQDYPIHLFSHLAPGEPALHTARKVWPPLATGVASTCIAYLAFLMSGVTGLAQLACLTIAGLLAAGLTTRFLLPRIVPMIGRDPARSAWLARLNAQIERLPRPYALIAVIPLLAAGIFLWRPEGFWQNDLSKLTPVPPELLKRDAELRREMATPDLRYLLVAGGASEDAVLSELETLEPQLERAVREGAIGSFEHAAQYLPSAALQKKRQAALPDRAALRAMLSHAVAASPFEPDVFEPFLADVERARALPPLTRADLRGTPLDLRLGSELFPRGARWYGLISLFDVHDAQAIARLAESRAGSVTFLDLKAASEQLVTAQRSRILFCLEIAAVLLIAVISFTLRRWSRVLRVLAPMILTTLVILAVLRASGVSLSLFHLISLVLAAGLGLDYALFFEHAAADPAEQQRTLHALLVCSATTLLVFALFSLSTVPILQAIGVTVSLGVLSNFVLALLLTRERIRA
ncbi:MAG TPA: MMPL family transporter [Steroidobacteraceae bacterium]|jgi:predicted exporter|nr:MMPL family transporter [Steroidobacteraceae bacterium]